MHSLQSLEKEFFRERKWKKFWSFFSIFVLAFATILFLIIIFKVRYTADTKLVIIQYWSYFTSISSILLIPYYQIPQLLLNLHSQSEDSELVGLSYELVREKPEFFLFPILKGLHTKEADAICKSQKCPELETIVRILSLEDRANWKKIGHWYFGFYLVVSPFILGLFIQGLVSW